MPRYIASEMNKVHADVLNAVVSMYTEYFRKILGCSNSGSPLYPYKKWTKGHHMFVPSSSTRDVITCLQFVRDHLVNIYKEEHNTYQHRTLKFLDCGCGIGNIMLLAKAIRGYHVTGLEYEEEVCKAAKILLHGYDNSGVEVIHQDILTYEHYNIYDVIYYYEPLSDDKKLKTFAEKVRNDMKVGAVAVTYGGGSGLLYRDGRFKAFLENSKTIPAGIRCMAHKKVRK